jgi:RNase H-like domain found in reverse transcriptase
VRQAPSWVSKNPPTSTLGRGAFDCIFKVLKEFSWHRIVTYDASDIGIGAVLEQEGEHGSHPVAFASKKLSSAENNYPVHELELLAIVYAL